MQNFKNISKMNLRIRTHTFRTEDKMHAILLLPGIMHQPAADRILERFEIFGLMVNLSLRRCAVSGLFKRLLSCRAYFSLENKTKWRVAPM